MWMNAAFKLRSGVWESFCTSQGKPRFFLGGQFGDGKIDGYSHVARLSFHVFKGFSGMSIYVLSIRVFKQVVGKK